MQPCSANADGPLNKCASHLKALSIALGQSIKGRSLGTSTGPGNGCAPDAILTAWLSGAAGSCTRVGTRAIRWVGEKPSTPLLSRKVPHPQTNPRSVSAIVWLSPGRVKHYMSQCPASYEASRALEWLPPGQLSSTLRA